MNFFQIDFHKKIFGRVEHEANLWKGTLLSLELFGKNVSWNSLKIIREKHDELFEKPRTF